jgi:hypothetical protein
MGGFVLPQIIGFGSATPGTIGITTAAGTVLAASAARRYAYFCNDSDTVMYLGLGSGTALAPLAGKGIRLNANGGMYEMTRGQANVFTGVVQAIHGGSGTKSLIVLQG